MTDFHFRLHYLLVVSAVVLCSTKLGAQAEWRTEREKEHGMLRLSISNSSDPVYHFIGEYPDGSRTDTLRNTEAHCDLGSNDPNYGYRIAHIVKAMPPELYGRKGEHLYDNWEYVSFPVLGLSSAKVWVDDRSSRKRMEIHFTLVATDTADYVFDIGFSEGAFLVDAAELKRTGSEEYQYARRRLDEDARMQTATRSDLAISKVVRSMTGNRKLDIVGVENPEPMRCVPFFDRLRFVNDGPESVVVLEHPWYTKVKYTEPLAQMVVPEYMQADPDDERQQVYCVERVYVKPVHLRKVGASVDESRLTLNHSLSVTRGDTTFLRLESLLEGWLFTQSLPCNWPVYSSARVAFPFNADSVLSIEMKVEERMLPAEDAKAVLRYGQELERAERKYSRRQTRRGRIRFGRFLKKTTQTPSLPVAGASKLPLPNLDVEVPQACDTLLVTTQPNFLNNGYYSWEPVLPCYPIDSTTVESMYYRAMVLNPYTMEPYTPDQLFGERFLEVVYAEMELQYNELQAMGIKHPFNLYHYRPQERRQFMWGLANDAVIIYYGNEGEFGAWFKHRIPFHRFADE